MGTSSSEELLIRDTKQEFDIRLNNITKIPMKHEVENEAQHQHSMDPFDGSELETIVQVKDYRDSNLSHDRDFCRLADMMKTEIIEFHNSDDIHLNLNDTNALLLEKIPKTETKILGLGDEPTTSSDEGDDDPYKNATYNKTDSNFDPELSDPFADIDCDPSFSPASQSHTASPQDELNISANAKHMSAFAKRTSPRKNAANTLKQNRQRKSSALKLQCQLCLTTQSSEKKLQTHMEICVGTHKGRRRFCVPCNRLFSAPHTYRDHALARHGIEEPKVYSRSFKCQICARCFGFEESLIVHAALHDQQKSNTANEVDGALKVKSFKCLECPSSFSLPGSLATHMTSHKYVSVFKCAMPNCGKAFKFNNHLKDHLKRAHSEINILKCQKPDCGKTFKTNQRLQKHMASHSIARPFKCPQPDCHTTFKSKEGVTSHMAVHRRVSSRHSQKSAQSFASVVSSLQLRERALL